MTRITMQNARSNNLRKSWQLEIRFTVPAVCLLIAATAIQANADFNSKAAEFAHLVSTEQATPYHIDCPCMYRKIPPSEIVNPPGPIDHYGAVAGANPHRIVLRYHVIRRTDGTGNDLDLELLPEMLKDLNHGFRNRPFVFVAHPEIVYIDNDDYYDMNDVPEAMQLFGEYATAGVANVFFSKNLIFDAFQARAYTSPYNPRGHIFADIVGFPYSTPFPPHEFGHFFHLWHPYEGQFGSECVSGSNCAGAGDLICDTPASPAVFSANTTATGDFFAEIQGPCVGDGNYYPRTDLYMEAGWSPGQAGYMYRNAFSDGQANAMVNWLLGMSSDLIGSLRPDVLVDCDNDGLDDIEEILSGDEADINKDMILDSCQVFANVGDLLVSNMSNDLKNKPRFFNGTTGEYRGDLWSGASWQHQLRRGPDGYIYMTSLSVIQRMSLETGRLVDNFIDGVLEGASVFVDFLFDKHGDILILDNVARNILRYDASTGAFKSQFATLAPVGMTSPKYMAFGFDGHIYVVGNGAEGNTIQRIHKETGQNLGSFVTPGAGGLGAGQGIVFHTDGMLYVSNGAANNVLRYDGYSGDFDLAFITSGSGGLSNPHSLRFGPDGNLYVTSRNTNSVKRYNGLTGEYIDDFIQPNSGGSPGSGGVNQPTGVLFIGEQNAAPAPMMADNRINVEGNIQICGSDVDCWVGATGPLPQTVCREGACYVARQRYLSAKPAGENDGVARAIRVSLDTGAGGTTILGFVQQPETVSTQGPGPNLFSLARIDNFPYYMDWNTLPTEHVTIGDCEIAPGYNFILQSVAQGDDPTDELRYSLPLALPTGLVHGDVTGGGSPGDPPNGQTSLVDVLAVILGFQNAQLEPKDWLDLEPNTGDSIPNLSISLADAFVAVQGFQVASYPGPIPTACP